MATAQYEENALMTPTPFGPIYGRGEIEPFWQKLIDRL